MVVTQSNFLHNALLSPLSIVCVLLILGCVVVLALGARAMIRLGRPGRTARRQSMASDGSAVATIEFALVLPVLMSLILLLTQTTLLLGGNLFVNYSAYAAARTAIVQIPTAYATDVANVYTHIEGREKYDAIRKSAVLALVPVSGRSSVTSSLINADEVVSGLSQYYGSYGRGDPNWVDELVADRIAYAEEFTTVKLAAPEVLSDHTVIYHSIAIGESYTFQPKDPISVQVQHQFNLSIPWINRLVYADGEHSGGSGLYRDMHAEYTLSNEGIRDELPPEPTLPRRP